VKVSELCDGDGSDDGGDVCWRTEMSLALTSACLV
jgi:hypothetical protein